MCLFVQLGPRPASADDATHSRSRVIYLATGERPAYPTQTGLLAWELYRQALLISARDEFGLQTRDGSLREWSASAPPQTMFSPSLVGNHIFIHSDQMKNGDFWQGTVQSPDWPVDLAKIAITAERLSRTEFSAALRSSGWSAKPEKIAIDGSNPPEIESLLGEMDQFSQFTVLRLIHSIILTNGESPERLGALVRAYANLGQLTRAHWSIENKVYFARSLLYAQRMVAKDPKSAFALCHRAYARALTGLHRAAWEDLYNAAQLQPAGRPIWTYLLQDYLMYHTAKVISFGKTNPKLNPLSCYLAYLTVEDSQCQGQIMMIAESALEANPNCFSLIEQMCDLTGPGMEGALINRGETTFSRTICDDLQKTPDLPKSITNLMSDVRRPGGNVTGRMQVCKAMLNAGEAVNDPNEPSLAALSRLVDETTFMQARRKIQFISQAIGSDATAIAQEFHPLLVDHPYHRVIDAYGLWRTGDWKTFGAALDGQSMELLTSSERRKLTDLESHTSPNGKARGIEAFNAYARNMDCTSFEAESILNDHGEKPDDSSAGLENYLNFVSSDSSVLVAQNIRAHWDSAKAKEYELQNSDNPVITRELCNQYLQRHQLSDAERCAKLSVKASPDEYSYLKLADVYSRENRKELWLSTLTEYLIQPDYGLQHATVEVMISNYFTKQGDFATAARYADSAAATGAAFAEQCAIKVHTELGDWDAAEMLLKQEIAQYDESPYKWYAWCVQTGHGDRQGAAASLRTYLTLSIRRSSGTDRMKLATLEILQGHLDDGLKEYPTDVKGRDGVLASLHVAVFSAVEGDSKVRDEAISRAIKTSRDGSNYGDLAAMLKIAFETGSRIDTDTIDERLKTLKSNDRASVAFVTAKYFESCKDQNRVNEYLRKGVTGNADDSVDVLLIDDALRKRGIDPMPLTRATTEPTEATEPTP